MIPKPPIGITPRFVHDLQRRVEISEAIERYLFVGQRIPPEWIEEYNELVARKEDAN